MFHLIHSEHSEHTDGKFLNVYQSVGEFHTIGLLTFGCVVRTNKGSFKSSSVCYLWSTYSYQPISQRPIADIFTFFILLSTTSTIKHGKSVAVLAIACLKYIYIISLPQTISMDLVFRFRNLCCVWECIWYRKHIIVHFSSKRKQRIVSFINKIKKRKPQNGNIKILVIYEFFKFY